MRVHQSGRVASGEWRINLATRYSPFAIRHTYDETTNWREIMKAGVASENGLVVRDVPQPRPKPNEVLVKVKAASLNRADLTTARGLPHGSHGGVGAPVGIDWAGQVGGSGAEGQGSFNPGDPATCSGPAGH